MPEFLVDIIVPVWNRPVETRSALASFVASSPFARLVMVNNGSERETERILDEFAEALDDRAILLATPRNVGSVAAINLGISHAIAPYLFLADSSVRLQEGWLDPLRKYLQDNPLIGAVAMKDSVSCPVESDHGSFEAMLVKKGFFEKAGSFDESLDNGIWTLRDFARRGVQSGFLTAVAPAHCLKREAIPEFGSTAKRLERVKSASASFFERWGVSRSYLVPCFDALPGGNAESFRSALLFSARRGDILAVVAAGKTATLLKKEGFATLHENITFIALPFLFTKSAFRKSAARLLEREPSTILVADEASFSLSIPVIGYEQFSAAAFNSQ